MELTEAIWNRHSVRGFLQETVDKEVLTKVLETATRAVSSNNVQPWRFLVVTGAPLKKLQEMNMEDFLDARQEDYPNIPISGVYLDRAKEVGAQMYEAMAIDRKDKEKRRWWGTRGYRFFDAPAVILLYLEPELDETAYRFDMGCVTQNICLAAMEEGLGTCVEVQAINYQRGIREVLGVPADKKFVCGIAIGYPDPDFAANEIVTKREAVNDVTCWYGF